MSVFSTKLIVWNPIDPSRAEEFDVWVDTGASYSWVSRSRLEALGIRPTRRMVFRTIEGRTIERELAPVFVRVNGYTGGDTLVVGEPGDAEVLGAHTLESLGLTVDPVKKELVPTIGLALLARATGTHSRDSWVGEVIDMAIRQGRLTEPFSNEDFRSACPGFGEGTYRAFLWKHSRGNRGCRTEYFARVAKNRFRRLRVQDPKMALARL